jgi:uncharacterized protein YjbI with pentapeptide repeats
VADWSDIAVGNEAAIGSIRRHHLGSKSLIGIVKKGRRALAKWRRANPDGLLNLSDADLQNVDLRGANLKRADLTGTDLKGANLVGANLTEADLTRADLRGAKLVKADFYNARLFKATFAGSDCSGAYLRRTEAIEADFSGVNLTCSVGPCWVMWT